MSKHCAVGVCSSPEHCAEIGQCFSAPPAPNNQGRGEALARNAGLGAEAPRWRDVADELPQEAQEVLFVRGGKTVHGAWIGGIFWHSNQKMASYDEDCDCTDCRIGKLEHERDAWKRMAELQYGALRKALYKGQEDYPVEGALDALFEKMQRGEWPAIVIMTSDRAMTQEQLNGVTK